MANGSAATGLVSRVAHLGLSRAALMGARALLFVTLGIALDAASYATIAVLLTVGNAAAAVLEGGVGLLVLQRTGQDIDKVRAALGGLVVLRLWVLPVVLLLHAAAAAWILGAEFDWRVALAFGLYVTLLPLVTSIFAFLRGAFLTQYETAISLVLHGMECVITLAWAVEGDGQLWPLGLALAAARGLCLFGLLSLLVVRFRSSLSPTRAVDLIRLGRREATQWFSLNIAQFIYGQADVLLLRILRGAVESGQYWACYRLFSSLLLPIDVLLQAVMPRLAGEASAEGRNRIFGGLHSVSIAWLALIAGVCFFQPDWVVSHLLNESFAGSAPLLAMVGVALTVSYLPPYALGLAMVGGLSTLVRVSGLAAVVNLALCFALIPSFGAPGAAFATFVTYLMMKGIFWLEFKKRRLEPMPWKTMAGVAALTAAWALGSWWVALRAEVAIALWGALIAALLAWEVRRSAGRIEGGYP